MKRSKGLFAICLTALFGFGVAAGLTVSKNASKNIRVAEAGSGVYLIGDCNNWKTNDSNFEFTQVLELGNQYVIVKQFSLNEEFLIYWNNGYYGKGDNHQIKIGDDVIFYKPNNDNDANWKCGVAGEYAIYINSGWTGSWGDRSYGISTERTIYEATPSASPSTYRVWVRPNVSWWWDQGAVTAVKVTTSTGDHHYIMPSQHNPDNSLYYWYIDVPLNDTSGIQFERLAFDKHTVKDYAVYMTDIYSTGVYFINSDMQDGNQKVSFGCIDDLSVDMFAKVLEAFLTCSSSDKNGYGAYGGLYNNFYSHLSAEEKIAINSINMQDYADGDTEYHGGKTKTTTVGAKWAAMASASGSSKIVIPVFNSDNSTNVIVITMVSVVALGSIAGYFLLKKKRI